MTEVSKQNPLTNALKLITGTTFAQILGAIIMPLLSRIYSPEAFGLYQLFLSITFMLVPLITFNYEVAILIPERDEDALSILLGIIIIATTSSFLCYPLIYAFHDPILNLFNAEGLGRFIYLIPIDIFAIGVFTALSFWVTRNGSFGQIAACYSWQAIINQGTKLGLGYVTSGISWGLISGNIIADFIVLIILLKEAIHGLSKTLKKALSWDRLKHNLFLHHKFPLFVLPSKFIFQGTAELPSFMLAYFFTPNILGFYALGHKLLWMPLAIVSNAVSRVLLQQSTSNKNDIHVLQTSTKRILEHLMIISVYPLATLGVIAPSVFTFVFGPQWHQAGVFTSILCIWGITSFIFAPFIELTSILDKQHIYLVYNVISFILRFFMLALGGFLANPIWAIYLLSISNAVLMTALGFIVLSYVNVQATTILKLAWRNIISMLMGIAPLLIWKMIGMSGGMLLLFIPSSLVLFLIVIIKREKIFYTEMRQILSSWALSTKP